MRMGTIRNPFDILRDRTQYRKGTLIQCGSDKVSPYSIIEAGTENVYRKKPGRKVQVRGQYVAVLNRIGSARINIAHAQSNNPSISVVWELMCTEDLKLIVLLEWPNSVIQFCHN